MAKRKKSAAKRTRKTARKVGRKRARKPARQVARKPARKAAGKAAAKPARKGVKKRKPARRPARPRPRPAAPEERGTPVVVADIGGEFAVTGLGAAAVECLDQEVATTLVFSCTTVGPVDPRTTLGTLFPGDTQRRGFCGCVFRKAQAAGVAVGAGDIPCAASNTIGDVIDRISC